MGLGNSKAAVSVPVIRPALDQTEVPDSRETEPDDSSSTVHASKEAATTNSGCPMHRGNGTYSYDWRALLRAGFPHGPGGSTPLTKEDAQSKVVATDASSVSPSVPEATVPTSVSSGCPVQQPLSSSSSSSKQPGGCPVKQRPEYNVYAQPIDPTNQMPSNPNQLPAPTQSALLSTKRVVSSIPKVCVFRKWKR